MKHWMGILKATLAVAALTLTVQTAADLGGTTATAIGTRQAQAGVSTGACCVGESCFITPPPGGNSSCPDFQGIGTTCDPNPCMAEPPTGACCAEGDCFQATGAFCEANIQGTYQGDNSSCTSPGICEPLPTTGACCFNGGCSETTSTTCGNGNIAGSFQGAGTSCTQPGICEPPPAEGACCDGFGGCQVLLADTCANTGGNYQGDNTSCTQPGICPAPTTTTTLPPTTTSTTSTTVPVTGACCHLEGCSQLESGACSNIGGNYQGDDTTCDSVGICSACGDGHREAGEECDDGNTATGDGCDDACTVEDCWACEDVEGYVGSTTTSTLALGGFKRPISECEPDDLQSCDDGDECTVGDSCSAGTCEGQDVLIPAACEWVMVGGDPSRSVMSRTRFGVTVTGDVCGETTRIGDSATHNGDVVATANTGNGSFFAAAAVVNGDVVTDGAAVTGKPRGTLLPGLATDTVAGGTSAVQSGNPDFIYDALGTSTRADDCDDAQDDVDAGAAAIDALPSTESRGDVKVKGNQTLTINATNVGGLNVIDFERLYTGNNATIELNGGGNAATVFILRIEKKFDLYFGSDLLLTNGTVPGNVVVYSGGKCKIGEDTTGAGTVLCPNGKLLVEERSVWTGALLGGRKLVQVRDSGSLTHAPLQIGG